MNKEELIQQANEQIRYINDMLEARKEYEQRVIQAIAQVRQAMLSSQQPEQEPQKDESQ